MLKGKSKNPFAKAKKSIQNQSKKDAVTSYDGGDAPARMKSGTYPLYKSGKPSSKKTKSTAKVAGRAKKGKGSYK